MKKSILILLMLVIPVLALAQTAEEYFNKGATKEEKGDYTGAINDYSKAIDLNPNAYHAFYLRGNAKSVLGNKTGAIKDYNESIKIKPNKTAYHDRAVAKSKLGDYRGVIQDLNKAIELEPNISSAYFVRGIVKIHLGQKDSGCLDLSKAGELGYSQAYYAIKQVCQ